MDLLNVITYGSQKMVLPWLKIIYFNLTNSKKYYIYQLSGYLYLNLVIFANFQNFSNTVTSWNSVGIGLYYQIFTQKQHTNI